MHSLAVILQDTALPNQLNALFTAFVTVCVIVLNQLIQWLRNKKPAGEMKSNVSLLVEKVESMEKELKTNGGSSIKDFVSAIHTDVKGLTAEFSNLKSQQRVRMEMQLNASPDCIFICNEKGDCTFANKKLQDLFGLSKDEMLNSNWLVAITNQSEKRNVYEEWNKTVNDKISFSMEYTITNARTKQTFRVLAQAEPIRDDAGNLLWFAGTVRTLN